MRVGEGVLKTLSQQKKIWARWHVPVISATVGNVKQEDQGPDQPGQKDPMSKITRVKREGGVRSPEFKPQYHQKKKG
jgi:hypothetical protein